MDTQGKRPAACPPREITCLGFSGSARALRRPLFRTNLQPLRGSHTQLQCDSAWRYQAKLRIDHIKLAGNAVFEAQLGKRIRLIQGGNESAFCIEGSRDWLSFPAGGVAEYGWRRRPDGGCVCVCRKRRPSQTDRCAPYPTALRLPPDPAASTRPCGRDGDILILAQRCINQRIQLASVAAVDAAGL